MNAETKYIYLLNDPRENDLRCYIGQSSNPERRLKQHTRSGREADNPKKRQWKEDLLRNNLTPELKILDEINPIDGKMNADAVELKWISRFYQSPYNMVMNGTNTIFDAIARFPRESPDTLNTKTCAKYIIKEMSIRESYTNNYPTYDDEVSVSLPVAGHRDVDEPHFYTDDISRVSKLVSLFELESFDKKSEILNFLNSHGDLSHFADIYSKIFGGAFYNELIFDRILHSTDDIQFDEYKQAFYEVAKTRAFNGDSQLRMHFLSLITLYLSDDIEEGIHKERSRLSGVSEADVAVFLRDISKTLSLDGRGWWAV